MTSPEWLKKNLRLKFLSLAAALILWSMVTYGKETTVFLRVPLEPRNLSPGLAIAGQLPAAVELTVSGSRFRLLMLGQRPPAVRFDLSGVGEGTTAFPDLARVVEVPQGVKVVRIYPAALTVQIVRR